MGRSVTPTFRLELTVPGHMLTPMGWSVRKQYGIPGNGQPTIKNLAKWVADFEQSCRDGANKHIGPLQVYHAQIVRQSTGKVMAIWSRYSQWFEEFTAEYLKQVGITWHDGGGDWQTAKSYFDNGWTVEKAVTHQIEKYNLERVG